jgi:hypothetical protein
MVNNFKCDIALGHLLYVYYESLVTDLVRNGDRPPEPRWCQIQRVRLH